MRLKNNPHAKPAIDSSNLCIHDPQKNKSRWQEIFSNNNPISIEIGCGKGRFLYNQAMQNPDNYYLGIERYETVLYSAIKKWEDNVPQNLRFICMDAGNMEDIFDTGEIDKIFLNFSDPWPKKRHAKRRLTSPIFLKLYDIILKNEGIIEFKTDNIDLFSYSLEQINECPYFNILDFTYDLYSNPTLLEGNIPTEYEIKFHGKGHPICKLIAIHNSV